MEANAKFLLKVADSLLEEVRANTEEVLKLAQDLKSRSSQEGFWASFKTIGSASGLISALKNNLNLALQLCEKAKKLDPNITLENGEAPEDIIAKIYFEFGFINSGDKRYGEAVNYFEKSLSLVKDQSTYFNLGLCLLQIKGLFKDKTEDAVRAFEKCIETDPNSDIAVLAGKELARLYRI